MVAFTWMSSIAPDIMLMFVSVKFGSTVTQYISNPIGSILGLLRGTSEEGCSGSDTRLKNNDVRTHSKDSIGSEYHTPQPNPTSATGDLPRGEFMRETIDEERPVGAQEWARV